MGYHLTQIKRGIVGEFSKIEEEFEELKDAYQQENSIMTLLEFSDLVLSIKAYLAKHHSSITLDDIIKMAKTTESAFLDGSRK